MQKIRGAVDSVTRRGKNRGTLWASIQARRIVEFYYHGGYRIVEPYALGITRRGHADNESLFCYQRSGFGDINDSKGWKLYRISEMEDIKVSREQFSGDRPDYYPENINIIEMFCCIQPERPAIEEVKEMIEAPETTETLEMARSSKIELQPMTNVPCQPEPVFTAHNEKMRQFRLIHPLNIWEKETYVFSDSRLKRPPERSEWENKHFSGAFGERYLAEQKA